MRGLLAAIALAACSGDTLVIEVVVPDGMAADQVELFIADGECAVDLDGDGNDDACRRLQPDVVDFRLSSDEMFFSDQDGIAPQSANGPGAYVFRLERGSHDDVIPLMVAVASAGDSATGVSILKDWKFSEGPLRLRVHLDDAERLFQGDGKKRGVHVWRSGPASCVGVERALVDGELVFVVSREDPDCDGFIDRDAPAPNTECDPLAWGGRIAQPPFTITCAEESERLECLLGENACIDGEGLQACAPTERCVPIETCAACSNMPEIATCLDQTRQVQTAVNIQCDVRAQDGGDGTLGTCDMAMTQADVAVDLELELFHGNGKCGEILFAPPDDPRTYELSRYQSTLEIQTNDVDLLDPNGILRFDVQNLTEKCKFTLRWQAPSPGTARIAVPYVSTIALRVKEGINDRIVMMPISLTFGDCAGQPVPGFCGVEGGETSRESIRRCTE